MTGEITLSGKVLPIGGLREKTMAAYKAGVKTIIVPFANKGDLDDVDDTVDARYHGNTCRWTVLRHSTLGSVYMQIFFLVKVFIDAIFALMLYQIKMLLAL